MSDLKDTGQQGKPVQMTTRIPAVEEPVIWIMVIGCKSGNVYVGHQPGQEMGAFDLCLAGSKMLHKLTAMKLAEHEKSGILVPPAGFILPEPPERRKRDS